MRILVLSEDKDFVRHQEAIIRDMGCNVVESLRDADKVILLDPTVEEVCDLRERFFGQIIVLILRSAVSPAEFGLIRKKCW